ncbi:lipase family alpha/beta hydrolase [Paenisporosarcina macmurdoensis]|uniref:Lipase family alpha/beta hydrolase n=1 Tax=Paenisporosarcina macmurdoensis TaxID=212659 RepID=A0ABW1L119_9BACL
MDEAFIYVEGSEIIINTRALQVANSRKEEPFLINEQKISIDKVDLGSDFIKYIPCSTNKLVYRVTIENFKVNSDLSFQLICGEDEYFFAIQDDFLQLLDDEIVNLAELLNQYSPRIEILGHSTKENEVEAKITKQQMDSLLFQAIAENQSLSTTAVENQQSFYIVLNKFSKKPSELGLFKLLPDGKSSFRKVKASEESGQLDSEKPIAIIVHGLVSSINDSYFGLFEYLQKGHEVYGFEYLTVDEKISDSGELLARELALLKKKYPGKEILMFSHSMGGLVSRSAKSTHGAPIDKLVMAGTPNNGSILMSIPILARLCLVVNGAFGNGRISIKSEDFWSLMRLKKLRGFEDLANESGFVTELNSTDTLDSNKKYFAITGKYLGLSHDFLVDVDNMITINEIKMPHISTDWNHFNYFEGEAIENYLGQAIGYLK